MVSQVICVVCSVLPEPNTTEITFYKFPNAAVSPSSFSAWQSALVKALSDDRPELTDESSLSDTYVCSQHFTAADFAFKNGKLVLSDDAVPSLFTQKLNADALIRQIEDKREYEPTNRSNNFASTLTKDFMTMSRHNLRSDYISTETSRALTPNASITFSRMEVSNSDKRRHSELEQKIESFERILKRLRNDNVLTESYVHQLKVISHRTHSIFIK